VDLNRWWRDDPSEVFWVEITDRNDLGVDLNAPQLADNGREFWAYSLITEIGDGDLVFHYHKEEKAIVGWSRASGGVWTDTVVWGAHGTAARSAGVQPYLRPGWRHGLEDFQRIRPGLGLDELRAREPELRTLSDDLAELHGSPIYFPLTFYPGSMRPAQGYLAKMPSGLVSMFPSLSDASEVARASDRVARHPGVAPVDPGGAGELGAEYRREDENVAVGRRDPAEVDPALMERGLRGHKKTQNGLADLAAQHGLEPRSHRPGEPNFDLAWSKNQSIFVVEVKSITRKNEEKQLRLGLGQVLRYRQVLSMRYHGLEVIAVLAAERKPTDPTWLTLASEFGVRLVWPETANSLFA
jgi:hypothetical protein